MIIICMVINGYLVKRCNIFYDVIPRQLSRHLVGLWVTGHDTAMALLKRIMVCKLLIIITCELKTCRKASVIHYPALKTTKNISKSI